jgi:5-methyltetrahydrofolate--homocysteine methyltransferase
MDVLERIAQHLQDGDDEKVREETERAIEDQLPPQDILNSGLIAGMGVVGEKFKNHEIFLPDVLLAAKAMYAGLDKLKPLLLQEGIPSRGKVVIGSVRGDLHDIGKNLVGIMLKGAGFEVIDLGNDVPAEKFVEIAQKENALIIGMSALLTTTMPVMREVVALLDQKKLTGKIKTIVGGAPVSESFAKEIGADEYGFDATQAVECVKEIVGAG